MTFAEAITVAHALATARGVRYRVWRGPRGWHRGPLQTSLCRTCHLLVGGAASGLRSGTCDRCGRVSWALRIVDLGVRS